MEIDENAVRSYNAMFANELAYKTQDRFPNSDVIIVDGKVIKGNDDLEDMIKVLKNVSDICYNQKTCNDKCPFYIKPGADYCRLDYAVPADWAMQKAYRQNKFRYARIAINPYTWKEVIVGER